MNFRSTWMKSAQRMGTAAIAAVILGLIGCQPEGTGTVKAPGPRGNDDSLGRPFGNAPEVKKPKKAVPEKGVQPKNERL